MTSESFFTKKKLKSEARQSKGLHEALKSSKKNGLKTLIY